MEYLNDDRSKGGKTHNEWHVGKILYLFHYTKKLQ